MEEYNKINFYTSVGGLRTSEETKIYSILANLQKYAYTTNKLKQHYSSNLNKQILEEGFMNTVARSAVCHLCFIISLINDLKNDAVNIRYVMTYGKFLKKSLLLDKLLTQKPRMKFTIDRMKTFCEHIKTLRHTGAGGWDSSTPSVNMLDATKQTSNVNIIDVLTLANIKRILI
jgi:hypothetical protein